MNNAVEEKKTLMSAVNRLACNAEEFEKLVKLSGLLISKLERTGEPTERPIDKNPKPDREDIIDMFYILSNRLNVALNNIAVNIDRAINMIE